MSILNRNKVIVRWLSTLVLIFGISSCSKEEVPEVEEEVLAPYVLTLPSYFPKIIESAIDPKTGLPSNPLTKVGVELGRRLFYDPILSANNKVSCSSCHQQSKGFADGLAITSVGVSGLPLERHSPALINLAWTDKGFFWDGGSTNLESQAFGPLTHADEMGMYLPVLVERLKANPDYVDLFYKAFGEGPSEHRTAMALAQFQRTLVSSDAPYDRYRRGDLPDVLSAEQLRGLNLVQQKCGNCHTGELFTDNDFHNNGLDNDFSDDSHEGIYLGRYRITNNPMDMGAFKTPTLRNVMVTAPYMHDGRFKTIDEVLNHYRYGIKDSPVTARILYQNNNRVGILLSDQEVKDIKMFLNALTDETFLRNKDFSNPFN